MGTTKSLLLKNPELIRKLSNEGVRNLRALLWHDYLARENQKEPRGFGKNGKFIWLAKCGRGFGKTRMFAELVISKVRFSGYKHIALIGATAQDVRTIMIEGESGILSCSTRDFFPDYEPSKRQIIWPNGAKAQIFYGTEPDGPRGPQFDLIWGDEYCKWRYPQETLDNALLGLRLGNNPQCLISTTPKPTKAIRELISRKDIIVTEGHTFENANNLAAPFLNTILAKYKGTRLERQEIYAQILDDNPYALWRRAWIDESRVRKTPDLNRLVVAVDPATTSNEETSNETGIIIAGRGPGMPGMKMRELTHFYVLNDRSLIGTPEQWGRAGVRSYYDYEADAIIGEKNQGGEMVRSTLHNVDINVPVKLVWASRGKVTRAEPVSALYEQGRVHHVGTFEALEDQQCEWVPGDDSPDRLDACVWAITELMEGYEAQVYDVNGKRIP